MDAVDVEVALDTDGVQDGEDAIRKIAEILDFDLSSDEDVQALITYLLNGHCVRILVFLFPKSHLISMSSPLPSKRNRQCAQLQTIMESLLPGKASPEKVSLLSGNVRR